MNTASRGFIGDWRNVRRICAFTGSRADYSPMKAILSRLHSDSGVELKLLVSGGHLVPEQGMTVRDIEADGFTIAERIDIVLARDSYTGVSKSFGLACLGYAEVFARIDPDIVLVAGDRYEALAAALVASQSLITVAHLGGGQVSYGSLDERNRHAITKLADLHFVVSSDDRRRLIQMGEDPATVFDVGMVGLDPAVLEDREGSQVYDELDVDLRFPTFMVTLHPATADPDGTKRSLDGLLGALDRYPHATLICTAPNVDEGARYIADRLRQYIDTRDGPGVFAPSLGQRRYLNLLRRADIVVGNSSSGINEAPLIGTPTVNIGCRQDGRSKASSIVDCDEDADSIAKAVDRALTMSRSEFNVSAWSAQIEHGLSRTVHILKSIDVEILRRKKFFDLPVGSTLP